MNVYIVVKGMGGSQKILCFEKARGQFWSLCSDELADGFQRVRRFETEHGAAQAAIHMGGTVTWADLNSPPQGACRPALRVV